MLTPQQLAQKYPTPDPSHSSWVGGMFGRTPRALDPEWQPTGHEAKRLVAAHEAVTTAWTSIYQHNVRALSNELLTPAARRKSAAELAQTTMAKALKHADAVLQEVASELPVIQYRTQQRMAPLSAADTALDTELRTFLRMCDSETRARVLQSDERALRAAAYAPAELSGLTPALHAHARETWLKAHHPTDLQAEKDTLLGLELVAKARAALKQHVEDFIDLGAANIGQSDNPQA
ncbi:MAG: hypothetical protein KGH90_07100 [Xanthomonadaceae bacterium]|nr:hypothetical protein [Xanthomonadaceae bacterium]